MSNFICANYLTQQMDYLDYEDASATVGFVEWVKELREGSTKTSVDKMLEKAFPIIADHLFVTNCANLTEIRKVNEMTDLLQAAAEEMFEENEWLDEDTKNEAIAKLKAMKKFVGAFDVALNKRLLDQRFASLRFDPDDTYREMNVKLELFNQQTILNSLLNQDILVEYLSQDHRTYEQNALNVPQMNAISSFCKLKSNNFVFI